MAVGVLSVLLGTPAMAQPSPRARPGPAKPPPSPLGAKGDESAPQAPPPQESAPGPATSGAEADRALLRGLLYLYEPAPVEIRVLAIEDLALLGDARALNELAALILDANPQVQLAAVRAVRAFQTPRAEEILSNVVRHPRTTDGLKLYAIQSLPFQRSPTAREFLQQVTQAEDRFGVQIASAAKTALQRAGDVPPPAGAQPPAGAPPPAH